MAFFRKPAFGFTGRRRACGVVFSLLLLLFGCAPVTPPPSPPPGHPKPYRVFGTWYQPIPDAEGFQERGIASWYGEDFHGRKTANGEIYDMYAMTAAHKTLPYGTYVQVRNIETKQETKVRINDRGPFVRGRIIDLSFTAAKNIGILGPGTAPVEIVALGVSAGAGYRPVDYFSGIFSIQVGAFQNWENAVRLRQILEKKFENVHITRYDSGPGIFYRVRIGKFTDLRTATAREAALMDSGFSDAFTVAE